MSIKRSNGLWRSIVVVVGMCLVPGVGLASDFAGPALPPQIKGIIGWLPADTDTLHVAQSFVIRPEVLPEDAPSVADYRFCAELSALGGFGALKHAKVLQPLVGKSVLLAMRGSRHAEVVSHFGSLRAEDCSIVVLEHDLEEGGRVWTAGLLKEARKVRQIQGHTVFVFDATTVMEGDVKLKPWQGTFLTLLTPKILLCASSDQYLEDVLTNLDQPPTIRALPDTLAEWQYVDATAPGWMLRHVPESVSNRVIVGVTYSSNKDRFRISYLPVSKQPQDPKQFVRARWLGAEAIVEFDMPYEFKQLRDGTVVVSFGPHEFELDNLWLIWRIYSAGGES